MNTTKSLVFHRDSNYLMVFCDVPCDRLATEISDSLLTNGTNNKITSLPWHCDLFFTIINAYVRSIRMTYFIFYLVLCAVGAFHKATANVGVSQDVIVERRRGHLLSRGKKEGSRIMKCSCPSTSLLMLTEVLTLATGGGRKRGWLPSLERSARNCCFLQKDLLVDRGPRERKPILFQV